MSHIVYIHWNEEEAEAKAGELQAAGFDVDVEFADGPSALRRIREGNPDAVVIDLNRLPSHGRETAVALRDAKRTRLTPIVFIEGDADKTAKVQQVLPDAVYSSWKKIAAAIRKAIAHPPTDPVVPSSMMERYANTPLVKKLGIRAGAHIALINAPEDFEQTLGELPAGAKIKKQLRGKCDLIVWFANSISDLERRLDRMAEAAGGDGLWIAWPQKTSGVQTDLTQTIVRKMGLAAGLVDYKICSIDTTWSALRFTRREAES